MNKHQHNIIATLVKNSGFFNNRATSRIAKSRKYNFGERVTPCDTHRIPKNIEYLFVSSMRWGSDGAYGGFILLNPRTNKLISATNIHSLDHLHKNTNRN